MPVRFLLDRCEFAQPKKYDGKGEVQVAIVSCLLWFFAIVIRLGFSSKPWTLIEKLVEAGSFVVFAGIPVFFLATPHGTAFARKVLLAKSGFWFQAIVCFLLLTYISLVKFLGLNSINFIWLNRLDDLIFSNQFWLNTILLLIGVFVVLRIPFRLLELRNRPIRKPFHQDVELLVLLFLNFIYISLSNTSLISIRFNSENSGYFVGFAYILISWLISRTIAKRSTSSGFDFLLAAACLGSLFWFSTPGFSFGVFISLTLFVLVVIHGTGLGREHFGFSFQVRWQDVRYLAIAIAIAILTLVPIALLGQFVNPTATEFTLSRALFLLSYAILFSFRVGVFEEVLFRSGLMTLIRDQFQQWKRLDLKTLVLASAIACSILFGVSHIGNEPGAASVLSPLEYKAVYAVLATIASLFYSFAFGETNRLWASIIIHGVVDTTAVVLLGAALTVPF
ncbi:CPBP family intramembrane metalloprotease [Leptolyngbya sp. FACHB-36]|uniref:CPBP family intramembrane glutamic endopeptidase n=1 Tax=Leptolyngbya sp. FACHB-36 TaxID=2692808 RepID=UPI001681A85B|nr:CPBP family intramembrane glutamic endopeptidase [Leptolyngbya sp. FACHB-36]MBD2022265.1 CPBP family intramembrane metalloprotease [Leptolyngbya sp. FACHB-36]